MMLVSLQCPDRSFVPRCALFPYAGYPLVVTQPLLASREHYRISDCLLYPRARMGGQGLEINVECRMNHLLVYCGESIR